MSEQTSDQKGNAPQDNAIDEEVIAELEGVPGSMRDDGPDDADQLAQLRSELDAAKQEVLYARADTQNVRRRLEKEKDDARAYAATGFARDMLSVADNLARALEHVPEDLRESDTGKNFLAGIEATQREIEKVFSQHGIARIAAVGLPLDPNLHQAMMEVPAADGQEAGTIAAELQAGYTIKDRLLRPAMVTVAK